MLHPGSSEHTPAGVAVAADSAPPVAPAADSLAALAHDADEPLPETYTRDELQLLVQSPYRLYAYWQFARDPQVTLQRAFAGAADGYQLAVRLLDSENSATHTDAASPARNYWFDVQPGRSYRVEVGFAAADKPFIRLLASDSARTPPVGVAPETDDAQEFHAGADELARVVNESGYAGDALALALEGADEATEHGGTLALAHTLAAAPVPPLGTTELAELRALIVSLVFAEPLPQVRARLSSPLARWLDALLAQHGAPSAQAGLLELLREVFGFELEIDEEADAAALRPTSFAWSASAVRQPERHVRVWLPSMTPGRGALPTLRPLQPSSHAGSNVWLPSMSVGQQSPLLRWRKL
ncbi:MAG: DUF4912 domain-containing protein [Pyrinomonadaceae bacterium]